MSAAFAGHEPNAGDRPAWASADEWLTTLSIPLVNTSYHPNPHGQQAIAGLVADPIWRRLCQFIR